MFAPLIKIILTNAGRKLAFTHAGVFYVRRFYGITLYRCPNTPVYPLNGDTAFVSECDKQRDRFGHLLYYSLCYSITHFPPLPCLAASERPPTKRASCLHSTPTPCAPTLRTGNAAAMLRTPLLSVPPCRRNFSTSIPPSAASSCATRASSSSSASAHAGAGWCTSMPTTSRTCAASPSRRWRERNNKTLHRKNARALCGLWQCL